MGYRHEPKKADLFLKFLCLNSPNKLSTLLMWLPQPVFSVFLTLRLALSKKKNVSCLLRTEYNLENLVDIAFIRYFHVKKYKFKEL